MTTNLPDQVCRICGLRKGGNNPVNHDKCAVELRRVRAEFDSSPAGKKTTRLKAARKAENNRKYATGKMWVPE